MIIVYYNVYNKIQQFIFLKNEKSNKLDPYGMHRAASQYNKTNKNKNKDTMHIIIFLLFIPQ